MLTGAVEGRRLALRILPQPSCYYARSHSLVRERPGLRYPKWPSLRSLSQSHRTSNRDEGDQSGHSRYPGLRPNSFETSEVDLEADEDDVWSSVIALEASRRDLDWRNQLVTKEQFDFESDANVTLHGRSQQRLVHLHGADLELWQELLLYRFRVYGAEGCPPLCEELISAGNRHKLRLWELPRMWQVLESLASGNEEVLARIVNHVKLMADFHDDRPDKLYRNIMLQAITKTGTCIRTWHRLMSGFLPDENELKELLDALWDNAIALQRFPGLLKLMPLTQQMYPWIMSRLVEHKQYDSIEDWHSTMVGIARTPMRFAEFDEFAKDLAKAGKEELSAVIAKELAQRHCTDAALWLERQEKSHEKSQDAILVALANARGARLSDDFIARLFATDFFGIETILQGLRAFHVDLIGPLAFRSAVFRIAENTKVGIDQVRKTISLAEAAGIRIHDDSYSNLVKLYLDWNNASKLEHLLTLGPDDLESMKADKKRLLGEPLRTPSLDREILLDILALQSGHKLHIPSGASSDQTRSNYLLQCLLQSSDMQAVKVQVIKMLNDNTEIEEKLFDQFWQQICASEKSPTERAFQCQTLQMMMRNGHAVAAAKWQRLILTLSYEGCMSTLEVYCSWLVCWAMQSRTHEPTGVARVDDYQPGDDAQNASDHSARMYEQPIYLREIFDSQTTKALVLCGFIEYYHYAWKANPRQERQHLLDRPHAERVEALIGDPALWGVRLLKTLHTLGLFHYRAMGWVASACESALIHMFEPMQFPGWNVGQDPYARLKLSRRADVVDYAAAFETIWETELFDPSGIQSSLERLDQYAYDLILGRCEIVQMYRLNEKPHYLHHPTRNYMLSFERNENSTEAPTPNEQQTFLIEGDYWRISRDVGRLPFTRTDVLAATLLPEYDIGYTGRTVPSGSRRIRPVYYDEEELIRLENLEDPEDPKGPEDLEDPKDSERIWTPMKFRRSQTPSLYRKCYIDGRIAVWHTEKYVLTKALCYTKSPTVDRRGRRKGFVFRRVMMQRS